MKKYKDWKSFCEAGRAEIRAGGLVKLGEVGRGQLRLGEGFGRGFGKMYGQVCFSN